jgi:transposase-like protein
MTARSYSSVSLKTLQALFAESEYSEQNRAIAIAVLVHDQSVLALAEKHGITRGNIYKFIKKINARLIERNAGDSYEWITAPHNMPLTLSRELTQWQDSVRTLSKAETTQAISALHKAIFKCRAALVK